MNCCCRWTSCSTLSSLLLHACINAHLLLHTHQGGEEKLLAERSACFRRVIQPRPCYIHRHIPYVFACGVVKLKCAAYHISAFGREHSLPLRVHMLKWRLNAWKHMSLLIWFFESDFVTMKINKIGFRSISQGSLLLTAFAGYWLGGSLKLVGVRGYFV